jgi:hypothetical protein
MNQYHPPSGDNILPDFITTISELVPPGEIIPGSLVNFLSIKLFFKLSNTGENKPP